jgi:hypothetical protein|tara:strand:- start:70 stop:243 length:174 start_codon:yes stop_codon:yes gene_type:complete
MKDLNKVELYIIEEALLDYYYSNGKNPKHLELCGKITELIQDKKRLEVEHLIKQLPK